MYIRINGVITWLFEAGRESVTLAAENSNLTSAKYVIHGGGVLAVLLGMIASCNNIL